MPDAKMQGCKMQQQDLECEMQGWWDVRKWWNPKIFFFSCRCCFVLPFWLLNTDFCGPSSVVRGLLLFLVWSVVRGPWSVALSCVVRRPSSVVRGLFHLHRKKKFL